MGTILERVEAPTSEEARAEDPDAGVTLAVARRPRRGKSEALAAWIQSVAEAASTFPGYQGATVISPEPGRPEYTILMRFRSAADLERWRTSKVCRERVAEAAALSEGEPEIREIRGLEAWLSAGAAAAPPRWKMAVLTALAIYPALVLTSVLLFPLLEGWPTPLRLLVTTAILVPLMTWVLMPAMTRLARSWLYPPPRS